MIESLVKWKNGAYSCFISGVRIAEFRPNKIILLRISRIVAPTMNDVAHSLGKTGG